MNSPGSIGRHLRILVERRRILTRREQYSIEARAGSDRGAGAFLGPPETWTPKPSGIESWPIGPERWRGWIRCFGLGVWGILSSGALLRSSNSDGGNGMLKPRRRGATNHDDFGGEDSGS
jgi:hypothetical protein